MYAVIEIEVTGTRSLLMHNGQLATQIPGSYEPADMLRRLSGKRGKTEQDRLDMAEVEFRGGLYYDDQVGVHIPADNLIRSLYQGASRLKQMANMKRAISTDPSNPVFPLVYEGPDSVAGLWGKGVGKSPYVYTVPAKVGQAKVDRTRPLFPTPWSFIGHLICDMSVIELEMLQDIATLAGKLEGVGSWREKYGRYNAKVSVGQAI